MSSSESRLVVYNPTPPITSAQAKSRYRNVCFTSFESDAPTWNADIMSYLVYGREICPSTSRQHWQCYVEFKSQQRFTRLQSLFPNSHYERRHGSAHQAASYCKKDNAFVEFGTISNQGSRSDLLTIAESIVSGESTLSTVAITNPSTFVQYGRGITLLSSVVSRSRQSRWRDVNVQIWWGETATGKTRKWFDEHFDDGYRYQYSRNNNWWDGYDCEKAILFDEFNCQILMSDMLMYLDGHPCRMEVKGSSAYAHWTSVTIISNDNPQGWYSNVSLEKRKAFARRINKVLHFTSSGIAEHDGFVFVEQPSSFVTADADV